MINSLFKTPQFIAIYILTFTLSFFVFQNCSPSFKSSLDQASDATNTTLNLCSQNGEACETQFGSGSCELSNLSGTYQCRETLCKPGSSMQSVSVDVSLCLPQQGHLEISIAGSQQVKFSEIKSYPILVTNSAEQVLNPARSFIAAVSGACAANSSWAPINQKVSPWTYLVSGTATNFKPGYNLYDYTLAMSNDMRGCQWRACIEASAKQIAVHFYAGKSAFEGGSFVGGTVANVSSEPAVAQACLDTSMTSHRFTFKPPASVPAANYVGKEIHAHAINGRDNSTLFGSGTTYYK